jgi:hypothetical protein
VRYLQTLEDAEVMTLLEKGHFKVDLESGSVSTPSGKLLVPFPDAWDHLFIRLHFEGKRKGISVAKLVWMAGTKTEIPHKWEVHHRDENPRNNAFSNLICLHPIDHRKMHTANIEEPIPF